jgi:CheY-like chemotaxis protein
MKRTVLVVDDDKLVRATLDKVLTKSGCSVILASSGKEALEFLAKEEIKVFILDLMMPEMDGIELCRKIRKSIGSECVIYALTGHVEDYKVEECRNAGFDDFFVKPFKITMILNMIDLAFEKVERWNKIDRKI